MKIETNASPKGFVVGNQITVTFDQEIQCRPGSFVHFLLGSRLISMAIDVRSGRRSFTVELDGSFERVGVSPSAGECRRLPDGDS